MAVVVSTISASTRYSISHFQFSRFGATAKYSYTVKISGITVITETV